MNDNHDNSSTVTKVQTTKNKSQLFLLADKAIKKQPVDPVQRENTTKTWCRHARWQHPSDRRMIFIRLCSQPSETYKQYNLCYKEARRLILPSWLAWQNQLIKKTHQLNPRHLRWWKVGGTYPRPRDSNAVVGVRDSATAKALEEADG